MTVLVHGGADQDRAYTYCHGCFMARGVQLEPATDWRAGLSSRELQVWELFLKGLKQSEIAAKLGVQQSTVSRMLEKVRKARMDERHPAAGTVDGDGEDEATEGDGSEGGMHA